VPIKLAEALLTLLRPTQLATIVPLLPGGVLVFGTLLVLRPPGQLASFPQPFGPATSAVVVVFASYIAGLLLIDLVVSCGSVIGWVLGRFFGARLLGDKNLPVEPWNNPIWRSTVREYFGVKLTPPLEPAQSPELFDAELKIVELIADEGEKQKRLWEKRCEQNDRVSAGFRWHDLYTALENIFPRPVQRIEAGSSTVISTALAAILVLSYSPLPRGFMALCILTIVAGFIYQLTIARNHVAGDRNGAYQVGMMLREIQARSRTNQAEEQAKPIAQAAVAAH